MNENIRQIELGFRDIGYIAIPAEFVNRILIRDVKMEFIKDFNDTFERQAIADYVYLEVKNDITRFDFKDNDWCFAEEKTDLLSILGDFDVTHLVIKYTDNSKEEFMVAWSDLEVDFLSRTYVRVDEYNNRICIVMDLDKCQFDKYIKE